MKLFLPVQLRYAGKRRKLTHQYLTWALALLISSTLGLHGQTTGQPGKNGGPRFGEILQIEVAVTNRAALQRLVKEGYDVDGVHAGRATVFADPDELNSLRAGGWALNILKPPPAIPSSGQPKALGSYNDYTNMTAMLGAYATNFPDVVRKLSLGKSGQNRELWALKITSNPDAQADKPKFKYISTMHGNEPIGTEMCLYLIDRLLNGYHTNDARIVNLVTNVEIWFLPLMNPDGRQANPPQRYNALGYDLNRSFPEGSGTNYGTSYPQVTATNFGNWLYGPNMNTNGVPIEDREVMVWTAAHHFTLGANFHSGALVVNYPYDNDGQGSVLSPAPDDALLQAMSLTYSSNNIPMWNSASFANGIVNGADWYAISGGMQDWNYRYLGCIDVTIELSDGQWPSPAASQILTYWSQNQESMLAYMEWVLRGVRGVMRDAQTGLPVSGAVRVEGYPHLIFSDPSVGDYHRLLLPGTYTLWFYAPGYVAQRIANVNVGSGAATRLDVLMQPVSPRFAAKINFQPASAPVPAGFRTDSGASFGARSGGYSYGWETTLSSANSIERNAGRSQDLRYDSLCQMQLGGNHIWELAVPNGPYSVLVGAGDAAYTTGTYRIVAENMLILDGFPNVAERWVEGLGTVVVTDGRLTISSGTGAVSNRLAFVEVSAIEPATVAQWRALYFGTTNNVGSAADTADPDGDSIPNLLEYALGLNPTNHDVGPALSPELVHTNNANWFGINFLRNTNATDLIYRVQAATSLPALSWTDLATFTAGVGWTGPGRAGEVNTGTNNVKVTVLDSAPVVTSTNHFLRLGVSHP